MSPVYLAACGETLNIDFTLPFHEFVPATCNTRFCLRVSIGTCVHMPIVTYDGVFYKGDHLSTHFTMVAQKCQLSLIFFSQAEDTDMRLCLPDCHPSRYPLLTLAKDYQQTKASPDNGMPAEAQWAPKNNKARWRNMTQAKYEGSLSFLSSLHPLIVGLMSVSKFCFCLGLDGWTAGVCQISCSL